MRSLVVAPERMAEEQRGGGAGEKRRERSPQRFLGTEAQTVILIRYSQPFGYLERVERTDL